MAYMRLISALAFVAAGAWAIARPAFDSIVAALVCLTTLLGTFVVKKRQPQQHQSVSNSSVGIQAGRNANVGDIGRGKDAE